jgi:hypothetical protein
MEVMRSVLGLVRAFASPDRTDLQARSFMFLDFASGVDFRRGNTVLTTSTSFGAAEARETSP